ncbi:hypothetical protein KK141_08890 [Dyella sp. LX-66]|uniref:hypothetical protein n=1 Tax=unclassified Dyella TaxID=2634549 RepID=UPI001BE128A2|nr:MULTISPECIES: hypothetical protein [unclassified Dyella]MBT2115832.1 hypothetical protein [Dyella sp. LX-1]MBT2139647.1 hypothetical protein [Dyella sp. LX-66]
MLLKVRKDAAGSREFAAWPVAVWLLLLLAAYGGVQYLRFGFYDYLAGALGVIVVCAGCVLRQDWARLAMRATAVLLACWAAYSGVAMWQGHERFDIARQAALANPQLGDVALMMVERAWRIFQVQLAIMAIGVPLLLWLAWTMGRPKVAAQFHTRRR